MPLCAQKVDTVLMRNGDRIIGEIKTLDRGALTYKTDDVGTLAIKWDKIARIVSPRYFEVEDNTGRRYYGTLRPARDPGRMVVEVTSFVDTLDIANVVRMYPLGQSFLTRVDGHLNLNLTFQRANRLRSLNTDFEAEYRTRVRLTRLRANLYFQNQEDADGTSRNSASLSQVRFLGNRWLLLASGEIQQNEELDLARRGLVTAGGGRFLRQTNRAEILIASGLAFSNERFTGSSATFGLEALLSGESNYFQLDTPKTDIQCLLSLYPSLTDFGRVRSELSVSLSRELIKNFNTGLVLFDNFDSRPPSDSLAKNDFGVTLMVGWTF